MFYICNALCLWCDIAVKSGLSFKILLLVFSRTLQHLSQLPRKVSWRATPCCLKSKATIPTEGQFHGCGCDDWTLILNHPFTVGYVFNPLW